MPLEHDIPSVTAIISPGGGVEIQRWGEFGSQA